MNIGDWIITSKQRYGKIIDIDPIKLTALIKIGNNEHWISMDQLTSNKDGIMLKVTYTSQYIECVQQVFIKRGTKLFDITDRTIDMYETVKSLLIKITNKSSIIINKIEIS